MPQARERIVSGTTKARKELAHLMDVASKGTPVTIVAGERLVTMIARDTWLSLIERASLAEDTAALLADPEAMRKLRESHRDVKAGRGVSIDEAARLLGLEK